MFHYQRVWENPRKYAERLLCPALPSGSCWETPCENCAKVCHPLVLRARMEQRTNPASCTSKSRPMVVQHIPIHKLGSGKVLFVVGVLGWMRHEEADGVQQLYLNYRLLVRKPLLESHVQMQDVSCISMWSVLLSIIHAMTQSHFVEAEDSHEEQDDKAWLAMPCLQQSEQSQLVNQNHVQ